MKKHTQKLMNTISDLLLESEQNRNSDYTLYANYIKIELPTIAPTEYYKVMQDYKKYNIFSFKAVERCRRKIQETAKRNKDLRFLSDKQVEQFRKKLQDKYKEEFGTGVDKKEN